MDPSLQSGRNDGPQAPLYTPENAAEMLAAMERRLGSVERNLVVMNQEMHRPWTTGKMVAVSAIAIVGTATISILAVKTWDWAFPGDPKMKR